MKEKKNQIQTNTNNNNSNANMENDNSEEDENDKSLHLPNNTNNNNISEATKQNIQNIIKNYETNLEQKKKHDTIFNYLTGGFIFVVFIVICIKNYLDLLKYT